MAQTFDHVIVGAGFSGLMLAWRLLQDSTGGDSGSGHPRILLIDPSFARRGPTTFAFWSRGRTVLDPWELGAWECLRVIGHDGRIRNLALDTPAAGRQPDSDG